MSRKILVPIDGSEHSLKAIDIAAELAHNEDEITLLNVIGRVDISDALKQYAKVEHMESPPEWEYEQMLAAGVLGAGQKHARKRGLERIGTVVKKGDPAKSIVDTAIDNGTEMIVMGTRGIGTIKGMVFGSVSRKVCHIAPCSVVTVSI